MFTSSLLATLLLAALATASPHGSVLRHHTGEHVDPVQNGTVLKRGQSFQSVRLSMYSPQTGNQVACGGFFQDTDYIVALNAAQFEATPGHMCGQQITVSRNGKSVQATIVDECPSSSCPYGGLDCSPAIATVLGFYNDLVWDGSWSIGGGDPALSTTSDPPPPPSTSEAPSSTSTQPPSSSHKAHTITVASSSAVSSTTSSAQSSTSTSSAAASPSATTSGASASVAPTPSATPTSNLAQLYTNVVNMALIALASEDTH